MIQCGLLFLYSKYILTYIIWLLFILFYFKWIFCLNSCSFAMNNVQLCLLVWPFFHRFLFRVINYCTCVSVFCNLFSKIVSHYSRSSSMSSVIVLRGVLSSAAAALLPYSLIRWMSNVNTCDGKVCWSTWNSIRTVNLERITLNRGEKIDFYCPFLTHS